MLVDIDIDATSENLFKGDRKGTLDRRVLFFIWSRKIADECCATLSTLQCIENDTDFSCN
jgi:hypothetical protein